MFVVFTDCESYSKPISTNPGSMEASEYGVTRGPCFVARRLVVVTVAGLLWISWCVLRGTDFFVFFVVFDFFFFERPRPAASMGLPCHIYLSSSAKVHTEGPLIQFSSWEKRTVRVLLCNTHVMRGCFQVLLLIYTK